MLSRVPCAVQKVLSEMPVSEHQSVLCCLLLRIQETQTLDCTVGRCWGAKMAGPRAPWRSWAGSQGGTGGALGRQTCGRQGGLPQGPVCPPRRSRAAVTRFSVPWPALGRGCWEWQLGLPFDGKQIDTADAPGLPVWEDGLLSPSSSSSSFELQLLLRGTWGIEGSCWAVLHEEMTQRLSYPLRSHH